MISLTLERKEEAMIPKYYIQDLVLHKELLFVEKELFINTMKRQDSKYIFASYNVSESDKTENKRFLNHSTSFEVVGKLLNTYLDSKLPLERFSQESKEFKDFMPIS